MQEIIKSILDNIKDESEDTLLLDNLEYKGNVLNKEKLRKIESVAVGKRIVFIDGGNAELLKSSDFSLHFIRVYSVCFVDNKQISSDKKECYCLITSFNDSGIKYKARIFSTGKEYVFDPFEFSKEKTEISAVGGMIRRLMELEYAAKVDSDYVVLDGSLYANFELEKKAVQEIIRRGVKTMGFSKTSRDFTSKGISVIGFLQNISAALDYPWYCKAADYFGVGLYFAKFSRDSRHVFKIESNFDAAEVLGVLVRNSKDYVFPGYPYGLLVADRFARVSNKEKDYLFTMLKTKFGARWSKVENHLSALDAHDILDSVC